MSNILDKLYLVFVITLLLGLVVLDLIHWPIWPKGWYFQFGYDLEQWTVTKFNDPLLAGLATPNGWFSGMYFLEQLHLPFLLYFVFAKSNLSSLVIRLTVDGVKKELGAIVVGTQIAVVVTLCVWEIWAFDDTIVARDQKWILTSMYAPFGVVAAVMVADMVYRVHKRVEAVEKVKAS
jgi:hypothetical protein